MMNLGFILKASLMQLGLREASLMWAIGSYVWNPTKIWKRVLVYSLKSILSPVPGMFAFQIRISRPWKIEGMIWLQESWTAVRIGTKSESEDASSKDLELSEL